MVLKNENKEWVAFNNDSSSSGFEAIALPSSKSLRISNRTTSIRNADRRNSSKDDTISVATWMKKPINSDASWAPIAPPATRSNINDEHPVASKKRPPKNSTRSNNTNLDGPNPVSSSSESSSSSERQSRSISRTRSSQRGNSRPRSTAPPSITVPLKSERLIRPEQSCIESKKESSYNIMEPSSRRGRSRTRNPGETKVLQQSSVTTAVASRGRSISQPRRLSQRERSSSASRQSSRSTVQIPGSKIRSGGRPPVTSPRAGTRLPDMYPTGNRRSRSTSRIPVPRPRSVSRSHTRNPPPITHATRREMRSSVHGSNSVGGPVTKSRGHNRTNRSSSGIDDHSFRSADVNIGRNISFGRIQSTATNKPCLVAASKRSPIMEKLFGDQVSTEAKQAYLPRANHSSKGSVSSNVSWQQPERIRSRILLTATVYHNTATNLWIATINTNQKGVAKNPAMASRYLKAFSFSTEKEARESAIANAPPKMMKFDDNQNCFICQGKFAMFRRAAHCRNCGVCVCSACSTIWPSKAIPDTYNLKKETQVKVCKSCNFLSGTFKKALLEGDYEQAIALYGSGNVNLRTPFPQFSNKKEEVMFPIHCAIEGGDLDTVRWLMEDHFCPVKVIRAGGGKRSKKGVSKDFPILTSKNRSVLTIAMESLHVKILRYLVVDNGVYIYESKDLKGSLRALEAVLNALPSGLVEHRSDDQHTHRWDDAVFDGDIVSVASSLGADATLTGSEFSRNKRNEADACIICYAHAIDCVMTPCGHQICCLSCSKNLLVCPVCNNQGEFIKIFRP